MHVIPDILSVVQELVCINQLGTTGITEAQVAARFDIDQPTYAQKESVKADDAPQSKVVFMLTLLMAKVKSSLSISFVTM